MLEIAPRAPQIFCAIAAGGAQIVGIGERRSVCASHSRSSFLRLVPPAVDDLVKEEVLDYPSQHTRQAESPADDAVVRMRDASELECLVARPR